MRPHARCEADDGRLCKYDSDSSRITVSVIDTFGVINVIREGRFAWF